MKVVVTGASGYLGGRVAEFLADSGIDVIAQVRNLPEKSEVWVGKMAGLLQGDIRTPEMLQSIVGANPDAVIYTISLNHSLSEENIDSSLETNVTPVWKLLDALGEECRRFVYFSTQQVYGNIQQGEMVSESRQLAPLNNYGLTHLMGEVLCRFFSSKREGKYISLRLSNGFGAPAFSSSDCWWLVINDFCQTAMREREIRLLSDGTPQRDFIHVSDICRAVLFLLGVPEDKILHDEYNIGSGETHNVFELACYVAMVFQKQYSVEIPIYIDNKKVERSDANFVTEKMEYDIQRIKSLGFETEMTIETGIREMLGYLEKRGS